VRQIEGDRAYEAQQKLPCNDRRLAGEGGSPALHTCPRKSARYQASSKFYVLLFDLASEGLCAALRSSMLPGLRAHGDDPF